MLGRENKLEAPFSRVQIRPRLARCVNRVIVQNHKYHALFRVSVVNHLEIVDEIRAFVPFSDEAVHFACNQVDASKKRQGSVSLLLVVSTRESVAVPR